MKRRKYIYEITHRNFTRAVVAKSVGNAVFKFRRRYGVQLVPSCTVAGGWEDVSVNCISAVE